MKVKIMNVEGHPEMFDGSVVFNINVNTQSLLMFSIFYLKVIPKILIMATLYMVSSPGPV